MYIGLDVGTTSCKAVVFNEALEMLDSRKQGYKTYTLAEGYATQNPEDIVSAVKNVLVPLIEKYDIKSISLSTAMHSLMLEGGYSPMILWSDTRASSVVPAGSYNEVYMKTGLPIHPMSPFAKLLWFQKNEPESLALCDGIGDIKSMLFAYLTGEKVIDYSCASGTGLFNIHTLSWDEEILELVGIDESMLPRLVDVDYCAKGINDIMIHVGAGDGCLSNCGLGAVHEGDFAINLGTSGAIRTMMSQIHVDEKAHNFCYYFKKDTWVVGHATSNAGNVFNWLQSIHPELEYSDLGRIVREVDSLGLYFIPYLNGERSPHWDSRDRAGFIGLSHIHSSEMMVKAALEGIFYNIRKLYELMPVNNEGLLRLSGGLLEDSDICSLFAKIMGVEFELIEYDEAACLGAVLLLLDRELEMKSYKIKETSNEYEQAYQKYLLIDAKYRELLDVYNTRF